MMESTLNDNGRQPDVGDERNLNLEELVATVTQFLESYGLLGVQSDHRVSAIPDARTVRYYTTLGLMDRPRVVGRQAFYGRRHVLQLLAIKALQSASLPLAEIQGRLYGRSNAELEAVLAALSTTQKTEQAEFRVVRWREIPIEPGLKILAEESWSPGLDMKALEERICVVLAALTSLKQASTSGDIQHER